MTNELDNNPSQEQAHSGSHSGAWIAILGAGLVLALAGDGYLLNRSNQLRDDLAQSRDNTQTQLSKISEATTTLLEQRGRRVAQFGHLRLRVVSRLSEIVPKLVGPIQEVAVACQRNHKTCAQDGDPSSRVGS